MAGREPGSIHRTIRVTWLPKAHNADTTALPPSVDRLLNPKVPKLGLQLLSGLQLNIPQALQLLWQSCLFRFLLWFPLLPGRNDFLPHE